MAVGYDNGARQRQNQQGSANRTDQEGAARPEDWDAIKEEVGQMAGAAVEQGRHFLDSARLQATTYVDRRKDDAAQSVADLAQSLREACRQFDDRPNIQAFVDSAAAGLEQLADNIRGRSFGEILTDVEEVVRRRPMTVAATTFAAGFLAARFIKSSAEGIRQAEMRRRRDATATGARAQASPGSAYTRSRA